MLIGKTTAQKEQAEQERLARLYNKRVAVFAWLPKCLVDGRIAWLQFVYKKSPVVKCLDGEYLWKWFSKIEYYSCAE